MIRQLADDGKTVLISSHILTELAELVDTVGIIEQGHLLITGSVEDIRREQALHCELTIRVLGRTAEAAIQLATRDGVEHPIVDGDLIRFGFEGDIKGQAALVTWMVNHGFEVAEVTSHKKSLEDVFLQVTEGKVQ